MTSDRRTTPAGSLNRRQVIGAGAALTGTAMGIGSGHRAVAADEVAPDVSSLVVGQASQLGPPNPALEYRVIGAAEFFPDDGGNVRRMSLPGLYLDNRGQVTAVVDVPPGSFIEDLTVGVRVRTADAATSANVLYQTNDISAGIFNIGTDITWEPSLEVQTKTTRIGRSIRPASKHMVRLELSGGTDAMIVGAQISYVGPGHFVPIVPARAYDSRLDMSPDANGILNGGDNRTISVANARDVETGAVETVDVVPPGARSIAYNLAVVAPDGTGFLSVTPGGVAELSAASINWDANTDGALANAGIVQLDDDRKIKVFCEGGGSPATHFVVDVTGYHI